MDAIQFPKIMYWDVNKECPPSREKENTHGARPWAQVVINTLAHLCTMTNGEG